MYSLDKMKMNEYICKMNQGEMRNIIERVLDMLEWVEGLRHMKRVCEKVRMERRMTIDL